MRSKVLKMPLNFDDDDSSVLYTHRARDWLNVSIWIGCYCIGDDHDQWETKHCHTVLSLRSTIVSPNWRVSFWTSFLLRHGGVARTNCQNAEIIDLYKAYPSKQEWRTGRPRLDLEWQRLGNDRGTCQKRKSEVRSSEGCRTCDPDAIGGLWGSEVSPLSPPPSTLGLRPPFLTVLHFAVIYTLDRATRSLSRNKRETSRTKDYCTIYLKSRIKKAILRTRLFEIPSRCGMWPTLSFFSCIVQIYSPGAITVYYCSLWYGTISPPCMTSETDVSRHCQARRRDCMGCNYSCEYETLVGKYSQSFITPSAIQHRRWYIPSQMGSIPILLLSWMVGLFIFASKLHISSVRLITGWSMVVLEWVSELLQ